MIHAVCGLPRSGTTLLCNILNQNPNFLASSTSCLPQALGAMCQFYSTQDEFKSELSHDREVAEERLRNALRGMVSGWYKGDGVFFDKSRAWPHSAMLLRDLYPGAKIIVMVRDLRDVFASIEKNYRKNATLDRTETLAEKTLLRRVQKMFGPEGMVGLPIQGIEDMLMRRLDNMIVIQYERFVQNPKIHLQSIYSQIGQPWFDHDLESVENVSTDNDAFMSLYNFPHEGSGKVSPSASSWRDYIPAPVADLIMGQFSNYNQTFGYA